MKKPILYVLVLSLSTPLMGANKNCECGEHSTGITTYTVNGDGCCSSPIANHTIGMHYTYIMNEGQWEVSGSTQMTGAQAQRDCCENV